MSSSSRIYILGAGFIGLVGTVSALFLQHFRQERRTELMARNLSRIDAQLSMLQLEVEELRVANQAKASDAAKSISKKTRSFTKLSKSTHTDEYTDASTSDLEYFDIGDEYYEPMSPKQVIQMALFDVDLKLRTGDLEATTETITILDNLTQEYPGNPELWYKLAQSCHHAATRSVTPKAKRDFITKGCECCLKALEFERENADVHKLYAILVGLRCDYEPTKQRIQDGYLFKEHLDIAIRLNPSDASLHHMLGRFKYEIAGLKWFERKVATALFGEPPTATYVEALHCFLTAEKLSKDDWKENKMYIGKCYLAMGDIREGVRWLDRAYSINAPSELEEQVLNTEIGQLLNRHKAYR